MQTVYDIYVGSECNFFFYITLSRYHHESPIKKIIDFTQLYSAEYIPDSNEALQK